MLDRGQPQDELYTAELAAMLIYLNRTGSTASFG